VCKNVLERKICKKQVKFLALPLNSIRQYKCLIDRVHKYVCGEVTEWEVKSVLQGGD
jgi:hypothetical protein